MTQQEFDRQMARAERAYTSKGAVAIAVRLLRDASTLGNDLVR